MPSPTLSAGTGIQMTKYTAADCRTFVYINRWLELWINHQVSETAYSWRKTLLQTPVGLYV